MPAKVKKQIKDRVSATHCCQLALILFFCVVLFFLLMIIVSPLPLAKRSCSYETRMTRRMAKSPIDAHPQSTSPGRPAYLCHSDHGGMAANFARRLTWLSPTTIQGNLASVESKPLTRHTLPLQQIRGQQTHRRPYLASAVTVTFYGDSGQLLHSG